MLLRPPRAAATHARLSPAHAPAVAFCGATTTKHTLLCGAVLRRAEREVMEACIRQLDSASLAPGVRELLAPLVALFAAAAVERELSWYMCQELLPPKVTGARGG